MQQFFQISNKMLRWYWTLTITHGDVFWSDAHISSPVSFVCVFQNQKPKTTEVYVKILVWFRITTCCLLCCSIANIFTQILMNKVFKLKIFPDVLYNLLRTKWHYGQRVSVCGPGVPSCTPANVAGSMLLTIRKMVSWGTSSYIWSRPSVSSWTVCCSTWM